MGRTHPSGTPRASGLLGARRLHALTVALLAVTLLITPAPATAFRPAPEEARTDRELLWSNRCLAWDEVSIPPTHCVFGPADSSFTLALVGDSHLSHLFPGFRRLARQRGWRLVTFVKTNCPFIDVPIWNRYLKREYTECATWNAAVLDRLLALRPDVTVTLAFRFLKPMDPALDTPAGEGTAVGRMLARVPGKRIVLVDTPYSDRNTPDCLLANPENAAACAIAQGVVLMGGVRARERAIAAAGDALYADLTRRICGGWPCRVVSGDIVMFRDTHHLTATYAATLSGALGRVIDRALGG